MPEILLKVDSAYTEDQGAGRARIDPNTMQRLSLHPGQLVYIKGKRTTVSKVLTSKTQDWNLDKIRIDKFTRKNIGVLPGDRVTVWPVDNQVEIDRIILLSPSDVRIDLESEDLVNSLVKYIKPLLVNYPVLVDDVLPIVIPSLNHAYAEFKVASIEPPDGCIISKNTCVEVVNDIKVECESRSVSYEDIGGLKSELNRIREIIELPIRHPELFETMGIDPPKGVLLYGPPGTGKTLIAKAVADECDAHFVSISGPEIISKYYGESEQKLREIFEEAEVESPSIIFIDELDSIAPLRDDVSGEVERRVVAQLLTMLDGLNDRGNVVVIGATNRPESIDPALRRPGRFDREIEIGVPTESDRFEILQIHTRYLPFEGISNLKALRINGTPKKIELAEKKYNLNREKLIAKLAKISKGFVGADLAALVRESAIRALRRNMNLFDIESERIPDTILQTLEVTESDFMDAFKEVMPSAMRELSFDLDNTQWSDIGGLNQVLTEVREAIEYPLTNPISFEQLGIRPSKGILLYGPPGTGKTLIAKAIAQKCGANFISIKGPELLSKWVGESERSVRNIFHKARQLSPSIIFFDEIDSLTQSRDGSGSGKQVAESVLTQILTELDGIESLNSVIVLAASNRPDIIDKALLRSGRFDKLIYIPEPTISDRSEILAIHMRYMPLKDSTLDIISEILSEYSKDTIRSIAQKYSNKSVNLSQIKNIVKNMDKIQEITPVYQTKRFILDEFIHYNVELVDPIRKSFIDKISQITDNFVGSDLENLCREAAMVSLRRQSNTVTYDDFEVAKKSVHPTMNTHLREYYKMINVRFKDDISKNIQYLPEYQ
ncbi:MAG TPA: CDC48 family AAA ATPase [Methanocorpusculum sp.]|nr:CDC48 family AAA ATPase [Methanocorpusculum sp.]